MINCALRNDIERVLICNVDLFAWILACMPDIVPNFMCHKLVIQPQAKPMAQRKRKLTKERRLAVDLEKIASRECALITLT